MKTGTFTKITHKTLFSLINLAIQNVFFSEHSSNQKVKTRMNRKEEMAKRQRKFTLHTVIYMYKGE